jgi:hypothetical protein
LTQFWARLSRAQGDFNRHFLCSELCSARVVSPDSLEVSVLRWDEPAMRSFFRAGLAYQPKLSEATPHRQIEQGNFSNEITLAPKGYLNACRLRLEFTL